MDRDKRQPGWGWASKALAVLLSGVMTVPAAAAWDDRSGELPGITSVKSTVILGAAVGGGLVLTAYLLKARGRNSAPRIAVAPPELNHGAVSNGERSQRQITITNNSATPVLLESIDIKGEGFRFPSQPAYPITLPTGKTVTLPVSFGPASSGKFSGNIEVRAATDGGKTKAWRVRLRGRGI